MRYAIWCAVSTADQADDDKESLPEQERRCRAAGKAHGWHEVGLYSAPGESRTRYVNLRDAETEIPELHKMLEDAKAGLFELVVLYDYNRLRDLLDPVAKTLASYGVQLFSVNQAVEPLEPSQFNPYASDAESMMRGMNQIVSRWQINDLRRKHAFGVMSRVRRGLHPAGRAPYGYEKREGKLFISPAEAAVAIEIKDLYLSGYTILQIIDRLKERGVPPPRRRGWSDYGVRYILTNPVYHGTVRMGYFRVKNDPRSGRSTQVRGDPSKILTGEGVHQPLWDRGTHDSILSEMKRRHRRNKGQRSNRLSNLLVCGEHQRPLRVAYRHGIMDDAHRNWYCRGNKGHWHLVVHDAELLDEVIGRLVSDLRAISTEIDLPESQDRSAGLEAARRDLLGRRERLTDALEIGGLDARTYAARVEALDAQLHTVERELSASGTRRAARKEQLSKLQAVAQAIDAAPEALRQAPAQEVNQQLRDLIERVVVAETGFEIVYRLET